MLHLYGRGPRRLGLGPVGGGDADQGHVSSCNEGPGALEGGNGGAPGDLVPALLQRHSDSHCVRLSPERVLVEFSERIWPLHPLRTFKALNIGGWVMGGAASG